MPENVQQLITYSEKYFDENLEYRHVILPSALVKLLPLNHLMTETEWRNLGVQQSPGWVHYMIHKPEPHILLFKRPRTQQSWDQPTIFFLIVIIANGVYLYLIWNIRKVYDAQSCIFSTKICKKSLYALSSLKCITFI